jgi:ferredoxin
MELRVAGEPLILLLTWRVWWPLLLLSLIFAGRIWCGVCPVYTIAGITQKWSRKVPIPEFVARWGRWMAILGFFVLVWLENYFHLPNRPRETAFILGGVVLGALLVGFLFQRNAWCRYLCPLGTMAGVYAVASCAEVRANRSLCLSSCTDHLCYKGTADRPGCPMYQHPLFFQSNMNCRFCFQCLTNCPHGAVQLNLRLPAEEGWTMEERPVWASLFARILLGFVISQFLGEWEPFREGWGSLASWLGLSPVSSFTSMLLTPLVLTLGLFAAFDAFTRIRTRLAFRRILEIFGFVGVPLALMGHLAAKLGQALGPSPATLVLFERHFIHWDLTRLLQILSLLVGTALSLYLVAKLRHRVRAEAVGGVAWASAMQTIPVLVLGMGLWFLTRA